MSLKYWQKVRLMMLVFCSLGISLTLTVKFLFKSSIYQFSQDIVLDNWQSSSIDPNQYYGSSRKWKRHESQVSNNDLATEVYYIPNNLKGNQELIQKYHNSEYSLDNLTIIEKKNLGYYGLFTTNNRSHLTTCLHPEGKTAFTFNQFANLANQNLKTRFVPWVFGISDLRDWRCFWISMSLSLDNITEEEAYNILQNNLLTVVSEIVR